MRNKKVSIKSFIRTLSRGTVLPSIDPLVKTGRTNLLAIKPGIRLSKPFVMSEGKPILVCVKKQRRK